MSASELFRFIYLLVVLSGVGIIGSIYGDRNASREPVIKVSQPEPPIEAIPFPPQVDEPDTQPAVSGASKAIPVEVILLIDFRRYDIIRYCTCGRVASHTIPTIELAPCCRFGR